MSGANHLAASEHATMNAAKKTSPKTSTLSDRDLLVEVTDADSDALKAARVAQIKALEVCRIAFERAERELAVTDAALAEWCRDTREAFAAEGD